MYSIPSMIVIYEVNWICGGKDAQIYSHPRELFIKNIIYFVLVHEVQ